jgi:ribosomal protein L24E
VDGQLNFMEDMERKAREDRYYDEKCRMYAEWLGLPEKTLIKDGSPEREVLSGILGAGYCKLYGAAHHECLDMPEGEYIWMNHCERNYWVLHRKDQIQGKHVEKCPYCGAELGKGKGDAYLYKADPKYWLFYLHYDKPMHELGYQPKEDREAIRKVWG